MISKRRFENEDDSCVESIMLFSVSFFCCFNVFCIHSIYLVMWDMPGIISNVQVFFPLAVYLKVCRIFECSREGSQKVFMPKQGRKINYEILALGSLQEVRHTFARVVFDTVFPLNLT